ncbi:alpha-galactosidase [Sphingobacterium sp. SRCM116780]|uniref:alpha-galactosidase n=1 Tax=Sphingobacterium sp. SRCM116780 TaxID=2907623 RepID=UPI001F25BC4C|nr:alpha-galactosidase [Sphingobacterium sp. SRCM116780]UIR57529.1 alpha-galactosidase [Sphingobacterium sp. SRCM116780]
MKFKFFNSPSLLCLILFCKVIFAGLLSAQTIIPIETKNNAVALEVGTDKVLRIIYNGKKLRNEKEYAEVQHMSKLETDYTGLLSSAYTPSGSRNLFEPAISLTHADGNPSLDLRYVKHIVEKTDNVSSLEIVLKDPQYDLEVILHYKIYHIHDVIEQWSTIRNKEKGKVILQKYASANLYFQGDAFFLNQYHGDWAKEMKSEEARLTHGIKTLDSKLGTRADLFQPPVFMVSLDKPATEDQGTVLFAALEWSGNFRTDLELDNQDNLRIISGINNYASAYTLEAGSELVTPKFLFTLSTTGKGTASRNLHDWARNYKLLDGKGDRLTLLNNWESTYFDFNEQKLSMLLKDTKALGVDLFLLDDGWFANKYPRNGDIAGLGDWEENKQKLPNGISSLVRNAKENQVKFGIWIEPEMVNPKSVLYEKHPDWVVKQPMREEYYFRNQLVLDLTNPKVQEFVFNVVDSLFIKNPGLAYIKWDCNAVIYNAFSQTLKDQSYFYVDYVEGLYKVLAKIRKKYPTVPMMLCSGGGGRVDYAALQYFTEYWPSDNTDPLERIFMQWEYSYFYPAIASSNHVTDWGKQPLKFRTDVAMMGKLGFDIVVSGLNEKDLSFAKQSVQEYNKIKDMIYQGDQYRLANPLDGSVASMLYLSRNAARGVVFNYLVNSRYGEKSHHPIILNGLEPDSKYRLTEINLYPGTKTTLPKDKLYSGDFLMKVGFNPDVTSIRTSVIVEIQKVN